MMTMITFGHLACKHEHNEGRPREKSSKKMANLLKKFKLSKKSIEVNIQLCFQRDQIQPKKRKIFLLKKDKELSNFTSIFSPSVAADGRICENISRQGKGTTDDRPSLAVSYLQVPSQKISSHNLYFKFSVQTSIH